MNVLYLSPSFPPNYYPFCLGLKEAGATVVGVGWEAYDRLRPELKAALSDYCQVGDMENYDYVLRAAGYLTSRVGHLDRVAAQEEHWLDLAARLRQDFNVPGRKPEELAPCRRKSLMKGVFRGAGIPVARGELATTPEAARRFAAAAGWPVIAKPDTGVGAAATYRLDSAADLEAFLARREGGYFLEEYLPGHIESFDGLTDREGTIVFCTGHRYGMDVMTAVNTDDHMAYWSFRDLPGDLEHLGRQAVAAFAVREGFFHIEFIRSPQGRLSAMEINARPPGGLTTDMFDYANDFDIYRLWASVVVRGTFDARWERPFHVCYIGRKSHKRYAHPHEEVLRRFGPRILAHTPIDSIFRRAIGDYAYLVRGKTMAELEPIVAYLHQTA